jgi:1,4-dihydroxy-2-naphthoate octaprenyltransferase
MAGPPNAAGPPADAAPPADTAPGEPGLPPALWRYVLWRYVLAMRPRFLLAAVWSLALGQTWGGALAGRIDWPVFLGAVFGVVAAQAAANVLNDVYDDITGTDGANVDYIFPYTGGSRLIQNGLLTRRQMRRWGFWLMGLAALAAGGLAAARGLWVLVLAGGGGVLGLFYSILPVRLSARGLGEAAVGLCFGVLPVVGGAWLQAGGVMLAGGAAQVACLGVASAAWVSAILLINEVPDAPADAATGKRTLVVRWPAGTTLWVLRALHITAVSGGLAYLALVRGAPWMAAPGAILLVLGLWSAEKIKPGAQSRPITLKRAIEQTIACHAGGHLWLLGVVLIA